MGSPEQNLNSKDAAAEASGRDKHSYLDAAIDAVWARDAAAVGPQPQDYLKDFTKTVPLFMGGRYAMASAAVLYAMDQMNPNDSAGTQVVDGVMGGAKGAITKAAFDKVGAWETNFALKGLGLGMTARTLEVGLTRQTYMNNGEVDLFQGLKTTAGTAFSPKHLAADVAVTGMGFAALRGFQNTRFSSFAESRFGGTVLSGTAFGGSSGAFHELQRQSAIGDYDAGTLLKQTFLHAALGTAAAVPGGVQASVRFNPRDFGPVPMEQTKANFDRLHSPVEKLAPFREANGAKSNYSSMLDYMQNGMHTVNRPVIEYSVTGHTTKLQIPVEFDKALVNLRALREQASQPMFDKGWYRLDHIASVAGARMRLDMNSHVGRFLPEDLVTGMDLSPNSRMINEMMAMPGAAPYGARIRGYKQSNDAVAEMLHGGRLIFYKPPRGWDPTPTALHEWAHIQHYSQPVEYAAFHAATKIEEYGWVHHDYAKTKVQENWAVHSEPLLGVSDKQFRAFADNAPTRAAVMGRALNEILNTVPVEARGPNFEQLKSRVEYIRQHSEPTALDNARKAAEQPPGDIRTSGNIMLEYLQGKITPERAQEILKMDWNYDYFR
jgi:hypothetical protein